MSPSASPSPTSLRERVRRELRLIDKRAVDNGRRLHPLQAHRLSSNGGSSSSSSSSSLTSPLPTLTSSSSQQPETAILLDLKSRLADREVEIELLRDRLARSEIKCSECGKKEEEDNCKEKRVDFDLILRNIADLNRIVTEKDRQVETVGRKAAFQKTPIVTIAFYANGFQLDSNRLRGYDEASSAAFLRDLEDGFFPSELQGEFPGGVAFLPKDKRFERKSLSLFCGRGRSLRGEEKTPTTTSSSSTSLPKLKTKAAATPPKKLVPLPSEASKGKKRPEKKLISSSTTSKRSTTYTPFQSKASSTRLKRKDATTIKVMGLDVDEELRLNLVAHDTIRTLKGLLANYAFKETSDFKLYSPFPRRKLDSEPTLTLDEVGLAPNGVVHVVFQQ